MLGLKDPQGLLHGYTANAEHGGQLPLTRQRLSGRNEPEPDVASDLLGYILVRSLLAYRHELSLRIIIPSCPWLAGGLVAARHQLTCAGGIIRARKASSRASDRFSAGAAPTLVSSSSPSGSTPSLSSS